MPYAKTSLRKEKRDLREKMRGLGDAGPAVAEAIGPGDRDLPCLRQGEGGDG